MLVIKFKDIIKYLACIILIISVFILIARYFLNLNKDKKFINNSRSFQNGWKRGKRKSENEWNNKNIRNGIRLYKIKKRR